MRHLKILAYYFSQYLKARLAYPGDFFIALFTSFIATITSFGFLYILFNRVSSLQGWSFEELLFIYGFALICLGVFNVLSMNLYEFGERYIMEGRFDQILLRPLHSLFQVLFEAFRIESLQEVFTGLTVVGYAWYKLQLPVTLVDLILFPIMITCGVVIYLSVFVFDFQLFPVPTRNVMWTGNPIHLFFINKKRIFLFCKKKLHIFSIYTLVLPPP